MLTGQLPHTIDPRKLALSEVELTGRIPVSALHRACDALVDGSGELDVRLWFERDEFGASLIRGEFSTRLNLECQRCLGPVSVAVDGEINVAVVWTDDQAKALPRQYDPLICGEELDLYGLIEDELLLSLPLVPYHPVEACAAKQGFSTGTFEEPETVQSKPNPFSVLAKLKSGKTSNQEH